MSNSKPVTFWEVYFIVALLLGVFYVLSGIDKREILDEIQSQPDRIIIPCEPLKTQVRSPAFIDDRICYMEVKK